MWARTNIFKKFHHLTWLITFLLPWILLSPSNAQLYIASTKDSLNNQPKHALYIGGWLKLNGIYDFTGIPTTSSLNISTIPVGDSVIKDPIFTMDMLQSRIKFGSRHQTNRFGTLESYLEMDFLGNGGGNLRLRFAYLTFGKWTIGHTLSTFSDIDVWPDVTDFDGPTTGAWVRQVQLAFRQPTPNGNHWQVSLETPTSNYSRFIPEDTTILPSNQNVPDLLFHYRYNWQNAHLQWGGVFRTIRYKSPQGDQYIKGWGLVLSGSFKFYRDLFIYQIIGGEGISQYMVSFSGLGLDAWPDKKGNLDPIPAYGGYLSLNHHWGGPFSSTVVVGATILKNNIFEGQRDIFRGEYYSANLWYHPYQPFRAAFEFLYGTRRNPFGERGSGGRVQFVMEYSF